MARSSCIITKRLILGGTAAAVSGAAAYLYFYPECEASQWCLNSILALKRLWSNEEEPIESEEIGYDGISTTKHPWETKVCVLTFGCSHNSSDGEYMKGVLDADGFILVDDIVDADVVVINSCTVKNPSQDSAMNLVKKCSANGQKVVVGGCVPQAERTLPWLKDVSLIGVEQLSKLPEIVTNAVNGQRMVMLKSRKENPSLMLPKVRRNRFVEIIPINQGCLGRCTYCKTRFARGTLMSYPRDEIIERMKTAVRDGVTQIWVTSEDTGAYGLDFDHEYILHHLLRDMCDELDKMEEAKFPGTGITRVKIRVGMTNPPYILNQIHELAKLFNSRQQLFRFLHIPVQSGSDPVLEKMVRDYTVDDFNTCIRELRNRIMSPPMKFSTDIICAFPDETDEDHQNTLNLLKEFQIDAVNISQYYARPGTAAAKMKQVDKAIAKSRTRDVTNVFSDYKTFDYTVGETTLVWFSEMSERSNHIVGHSDAYIKVLVDPNAESTRMSMISAGLSVPSNYSTSKEEEEEHRTLSDDAKDDLMIQERTDREPHALLGQCARVKINKATKWHIEGDIIEIVR